MMNSPRYSLPPRVFGLVSRAEAVSPFANFSRSPIPIVKHRLIVLHKREKERERERREKWWLRNAERLFWSSSTSTTTVRDCLFPFPPSKRATLREEKRPHNRGMRRQNQYTAPPPSGGNVRANHPWMPSLNVVHPPSLPPPPQWKNACVAESGNYRHTFVPCSTLLAKSVARRWDSREFQAGQLIEPNVAERNHWRVPKKNAWNF